jgi:hypothetical protein
MALINKMLPACTYSTTLANGRSTIRPLLSPQWGKVGNGHLARHFPLTFTFGKLC